MATRFKEVMDAHMISTKRLSELTGDTESCIRSVRSRDISTTSILIKYARAMNVPLWEFFLQPARIVTYDKNLYEGFDDLYIANKLSSLLRERNMPKAQLATLIDRHPTFVGRIFKDGNVTMSTLELICKALGIDVWELFISREELDKIVNGEITPAISNGTESSETPDAVASGTYVVLPTLANGLVDLSQVEMIDTPEGKVAALPMSAVRILDSEEGRGKSEEEDGEELVLTGD